MKLETRNMKITKLEDFRSWSEAISLAEEVYKITAHFPKTELYSLANQLQRAAVSVSANLAEGFGRQHSKDKERFYIIARGSLYEVKSLLVLAERLGFMKGQREVIDQMNKCLQLTGALIRKHRSEL